MEVLLDSVVISVVILLGSVVALLDYVVILLDFVAILLAAGFCCET